MILAVLARTPQFRPERLEWSGIGTESFCGRYSVPDFGKSGTLRSERAEKQRNWQIC